MRFARLAQLTRTKLAARRAVRVPRPVRRGWRRALWVVDRVVLVTVIVGAVVLAAGLATGDLQLRPVLSGSMRPALPLGGVVVTQRVPLSSLRVGDIAVFHPPGYPTIDYVHRIIWLKHTAHGDVIRTKGDANLYRDPWTLRVRGNVAYVARFAVPLLGYPAVWIHSPAGRRALLYGAGALFLVAGLSAALNDRRRARDRRASLGATDDFGIDAVTAAPMGEDVPADENASLSLG